MDPTIDCIDTARDIKAHLIITHHPLFTPELLQIRELHFEKVRLLTTHNIWVYVIGDGLNGTVDGTADSICHLLQLPTTDHVSLVDASGIEVPVGRTCEPNPRINMRDIVARATNKGLGENLHVHGNLEGEVKKIAVFGGEFTSIHVARQMIETGVDTIITGEMKRDVRMILKELGVQIVELSHESTDFIGMSRLRMILALKHPSVSFDMFDQSTMMTSF